MQVETKSDRKKMNINSEVIADTVGTAIPIDYVKDNYSFPETLGNIPEEEKLALDHALAAGHQMIEASLTKCGMGDMLPRFLGYGVLIALSQNNNIRAGIEMIADEMTRAWIKLNRRGEKDKDNNGIPDLVEDFNKYGIKDLFREAAATSGYFGGCLIFIDTDEEEQALVNPLVLDPDTFKQGSLKGFKLIEPYNVTPGRYNTTKPLRSDYYKPKFWYVQGLPVHESRFLYFPMTRVTSLLLPAYNFFGIPLAQIVLDSVMHFTECREAEARLLTKYSNLVFKTNMEDILSGGASTMLDRRAQYMNQKRSNDGLIVIDSETEDIINVPTPLGGVTDIVRQAMEFVAASFGEPATKIWGISPAGFNATGESDTQNHKDNINTLQEKMFTSPLQKIIKVLQLNRDGEIDDTVGFTYEKLSDDDEQKSASVQKTKADTAAVLIDAGVISPEEERQRLANDPDSGYDDIDPYDMPKHPADENQEEMLSYSEDTDDMLGMDVADDEGWKTINGAKVEVGESGEIKKGMGGKFTGKKISELSNKKPTEQPINTINKTQQASMGEYAANSSSESTVKPSGQHVTVKEYFGEDYPVDHDNMVDIMAQKLQTSRIDAEKMLLGIRSYSSEDYAAIRQASVNPRGQSESAIKAAENIEKFIEKSPTYDGGPLYRGINIPADILEKYKPGKKIDMKGMSSWSSKETIAQEFMSGDNTKAMFVMNKTKSGTSIKHISDITDEDEILVSSKTKFKIKNIKKIGIGDAGRTVIEIEEI